MNVGMMACYDQAKEVVASLLGDPMTNGPSLSTRLLSSATAGFTAALFSMPFDLVKSRLMAQRPDPLTGDLPYKVRTKVFVVNHDKSHFTNVVRSFPYHLQITGHC